MQTFLQDLKYALRMLRKNPAFTTVAILTLAVGIGANSAIFSVVNSVLLRPLPYRQPRQLVRVYSEFPTMQLKKFWLSPPELLDIQREAKSWEAIGAWAPRAQRNRRPWCATRAWSQLHRRRGSQRWSKRRAYFSRPLAKRLRRCERHRRRKQTWWLW